MSARAVALRSVRSTKTNVRGKFGSPVLRAGPTTWCVSEASRF